MIGWMTARLQRSRRFPSLRSVLRSGRDKARKLSPSEAKVQKERHQALIDRLAPGALVSDDVLRDFAERKNQEVMEKHGAVICLPSDPRVE